MSIWHFLLEAAVNGAKKDKASDGTFFVKMDGFLGEAVGVGASPRDAWLMAYAQVLEQVELAGRWSWLVERCHEVFGFDSTEEMFVRAAARRASPRSFSMFPVYYTPSRQTGKVPQW